MIFMIMEYLKFLYYHIYCWRKREHPYYFTFFDITALFGMMVYFWAFAILWLLSIIVYLLFGIDWRCYVGDSDPNWFTIVCLALFILSWLIPHIILSYKRNCFRLLLSMHRLYKDEYPYYVQGLFIKLFVLVCIDLLLYDFSRGNLILP